MNKLEKGIIKYLVYGFVAGIYIGFFWFKRERTVVDSNGFSRIETLDLEHIIINTLSLSLYLSLISALGYFIYYKNKEKKEKDK